MVTIELHSLAPRLVIAALLGWNSALVISLLRTMFGVWVLIHAQTYALQAFCRVALGHVNTMDHEALDVDTHLFSMTLWVTILGTHASGFAFAPRHLLLLGIQRLLRVPSVCASLWPTLKNTTRARIASLAVSVCAIAFLSCAYWLTDPFSDHPSHPVLLADGLCALITAFFEIGFLFWIAVADATGRQTPERYDTPVLLVRFVEAIAHLFVTFQAMSHGEAHRGNPAASPTDAPPIHVQLLMLKRLWLAATSYSNFRRSQSVLNGIPEVSGDALSRDCAICLEQLTPGSRQLPCGHCFHGRCLHRWLMTTPACPLCRRRFYSIARDNDPTAPPPPFAAGPGMPPPPMRRPAQAQQHQQQPPPHLHRQPPPPPPTGDDDDDDDAVVFNVPNPWPFTALGRAGAQRAADDGAATPQRGQGQGQPASPRRARPPRDLLDDVFGSPVGPDVPSFAAAPRGRPNADVPQPPWARQEPNRDADDDLPGGRRREPPRPAGRRRAPPPAPWGPSPAGSAPTEYCSPVADALAQSAALRRELIAGLDRVGKRRLRRPRAADGDRNADAPAEASEKASAEATDESKPSAAPAAVASSADFSPVRQPGTDFSASPKHSRKE